MSIEQGITWSQLNEFRRKKLDENRLVENNNYLNEDDNNNNSYDEMENLANSDLESFFCTCQGWLSSGDSTLISRKAYVKLAYMSPSFDWEPLATTGLIGKSVEIRCLAPDGEPKPKNF